MTAQRRPHTHNGIAYAVRLKRPQKVKGCAVALKFVACNFVCNFKSTCLQLQSLTAARREAVDASGNQAAVQIDMTPGYSDSDCAEALRLLGPELTETCCRLRFEEDGSYTTKQTFEQLLAAGTGPHTCEYDCAASFYEVRPQRKAGFLVPQTVPFISKPPPFPASVLGRLRGLPRPDAPWAESVHLPLRGHAATDDDL